MSTQHVAPTQPDAAATGARLLTAATAALVAGVSVAGSFTSGLYTDGPAVEAMFRGFDLVTLVVVAPLLAASLWPRWRDRPATQLIRLSLLAYGVYNYAYYLFGAQLNAALLAHVAVFTTSSYALVLSLVGLDIAELASRFRRRTPVRTIAMMIALLALPLAAIQISGLAGFMLTGTVPEEPSQLVVPLGFTRLGAVLDLSLLVPAYLLAAALLWRRRSWGFVLATILLVAGTLHQLSYITAMLFQLTAEIPGAAFDVFEPAILALFVTASVLLLVNLRSEGPPVARAAPVHVPASTRR